MLTLLHLGCHGAIDADAVTSLPGWGGALPSRMWSGYLHVDGDAGPKTKHYHYFFVEAETESPDTAPVALWLNGGPGSSSLIGYFTENGAFALDDASLTPAERHPCGCTNSEMAECSSLGMTCGCGGSPVNASAPRTTCTHAALGQCTAGCAAPGIPADAPAPKLFHRATGWQAAANMIFLESPAGVGFSYCDYDPCTANDTSTAVDNHHALLEFFKGFPEYAANEFFITGESYAGIYIPTLAEQIMEAADAYARAASDAERSQLAAPINLVGMAVGNGCWGSQVGLCAFGADSARITTQFIYGHSATSNDQYDAVVAACGDPRKGAGAWGPPSGGLEGQCKAANDALMGAAGNFEIYNYYDECYGSSGIARSAQLEALRNGAAFGAGAHHRGAAAGGALNDYPCGGQKAMDLWLARPDVTTALHVQTNTSGMRYGPRDRADLRPLYKTLAEKYRVLIYSGDVDACVPFVGTQEWTEGLGFAVTEAWRPWSAGASRRCGSAHVHYPRRSRATAQACLRALLTRLLLSRAPPALPLSVPIPWAHRCTRPLAPRHDERPAGKHYRRLRYRVRRWNEGRPRVSLRDRQRRGAHGSGVQARRRARDGVALLSKRAALTMRPPKSEPHSNRKSSTKEGLTLLRISVV
jgi:hypothetical protein